MALWHPSRNVRYVAGPTILSTFAPAMLGLLAGTSVAELLRGWCDSRRLFLSQATWKEP